MKLRYKITCKNCGKPFYLNGLPILKLSYIKGRVRITRLSVTGAEYTKFYDGVACGYKCYRSCKREGYHVLNYEKSLTMSNYYYNYVP